jgi:ubiquinone/menaquinone biosynthesis C-methylase UbiE
MTETNAKFEGSIPEIYDRHLGPVMFEPYAADLTRRVTTPVAGPVLEIACGTGILTRQLRAHLPASLRLVATDLNEPMLDYARTKLGETQFIDWQQADAAALPFPSASFAAVVCQFGLMFVPDKPLAFREARRVLSEGGLLAFNVWDDLAYNPFGRIAHETIAGFFPTDPPNFYQVPFGFHDPQVLRQLLETNGFTQVEIERVTLDACSSSAQAFAIGLVKGNPVSLAIRQRGGSPEPIVEAVAAALAQVGGDQPFRSTMQAVVVTARAGAV